MLKRYLLTLALGLFTVSIFAQTVNVSSVDFAEDTDYYWTADKTYILDDLVFIKNGSRLFIEPGTLIKGGSGTGNNATGLVITRGAQIFAEGTPSNPIIFTSIADQRDGSANSSLRGLWGGVVMLGSASTNNATEGGVKLVEGVDQIASPASLAEYGGSNDEDNSGVFRYVSIRHTGIQVGDVDGNEIQGLTLGGVGSGTTIEYVESFASNDDGFEFFGGTVNTKYLVSAFNTDDGFDWDEGFRGKGQFWFTIQNNEVTDGFGRGMEMDGATGDENTTPYAHPILANITILGAGTNIEGANAGDGSQLLMFRDNTGGEVYNSIFGEHNGYGIVVEDASSKSTDSEARLAAGDLEFQNNIWYGFAAGNDVQSIANDVDYVEAYLNDAANANVIGNPGLSGTGRVDGANGLNPVPTVGGIAYTSSRKELNDLFFSKVAYSGAFGAKNWLEGWTALDENGYLATQTASSVVNVSSVDFAEDTDYYWTADKTYILDDLVFIKNGSRLFIEPGTLIKGGSGTGNNATGLVITRGAQIFAEGTPSNPIIFTSIADQRDGSANSSLRGLWGGVVMLGSASTNNATEGGVKLVEGVDQIASPASLAEYGGSNDEDNSGVFRYVSIRHTGIQVGDVDGNEIQGLTLGGVGSGTTIEYVESFASNDDGFEFFGGTVNTKYLVSAFNTDDGFDWDEGFRGKGQFWFTIQNNEVTDGFGRGMEMDGATGDENTTPYAHPILANITILGAGTNIEGANAGDGSQLLMFRDNTGGEVYNSIFGEHNGYGIVVEDASSKSTDSEARLAAGDLEFQNNIWYGFAAGNDVQSIANDVDYVEAYLNDAANANVIGNPELNGTSRTDGGSSLDPRPNLNGMAYKVALKDMSGDSFFTATDYVGAFGPSLWIAGWTALDEHGYLSEGGVISPNEDQIVDLPTNVKLDQNYPNPFNPTTNISFALPSTQKVTLKVFNMLGQEVATLINNQTIQAGSQTVAFDASLLSSGVYIYRLVGANTVLTKKMTLIK